MRPFNSSAWYQNSVKTCSKLQSKWRGVHQVVDHKVCLRTKWVFATSGARRSAEKTAPLDLMYMWQSSEKFIKGLVRLLYIWCTLKTAPLDCKILSRSRQYAFWTIFIRLFYDRRLIFFIGLFTPSGQCAALSASHLIWGAAGKCSFSTLSIRQQ